MKITCQSCQSKYTVSDEKVQGKTVKIKCRKCGATILVNSGGVTTSGAGAGDADSMSAVGTAEGGAQPTFQVNVAEGDQRSMTMQDIVAAYNGSVITAETYVWADGMSDWLPLGQVDSIVAALNNPATVAAATATPAPVAYAPPADAYAPPADAYAPPAGAYAQPADPYAPPATSTPIPAAAAYAAPAPAPEPAAEAPRVAARRDPARRAPDLFGGGMAQQAVEEVATSAPLYNGAAMGRAPAAPPGRDENSMLFSLSALTAKAATTAAASSSSKTTATKEDSGVIDLKALANSAGTPAQSSGASDFMADHGSLFPLGAPIAAPAAAPISIPLPPPAPSKTPIFIGIGVAVASLAIVGAFFAMKGSDKPPPPPVETVQAPPPPPPATEVAPPPTATVEASAAPSASAKKTGPKYTGTGKPSSGAGGASTSAAGTTAAPTTKPKSSGCGCAPGDLMCAMKCSAK